MYLLKKSLCFVAALGLVAGVSGNPTNAGLSQLEAEFKSPPNAAKPYLWWHWMNGNISRDGITKDLEAMKQVGVGGVTLFEEFNRIPEGTVRYATPEHFSLIQFAAAECQRLGLDFGFHNAPGWSASGGPWITPEHAMKTIVWSETTASGGKGVQRLSLPRPPTKVEAYRSPGHTYGDYDFYRDVVVIAFPTPADPDVRLDDWMQKAELVIPIQYGLQEQRKVVSPKGIIPKAQIQVLHLSPNEKGEISWEVPTGNWTLLRMGYILTGHFNQQGPTTGGRGLDCDKLSPEALDFHWEKFVAKVIEAAKTGGPAALSTILIDSYETDVQSWTPRMAEEFERLRGYSLFPYLPCLSGRIVNSVRDTERFLWDFRRTIAELVEENYYGQFALRCQQAGLKSSFEGYGYNAIFDDFDVSRRADIPMAEFWAKIFKYSDYSAKMAASAADLSGRHIVGAEAFTAGGPEAAWNMYPGVLKAQGDYYLARGITRFYIQASVHQPWGDAVRPGMSYGLNGIQMNRNDTVWEPSRAWLAYLSRAQAMLQRGQLVTDMAYYYGENQPNTLRTKPYSTKNRVGVPRDPDGDINPDTWFSLPEGHDFHVVSQKALLELSVNSSGQLTHPTGARYEILVLPNEERMRLSTLRKIAALVQAGATVVGPRPNRSPSLEDETESDAAVVELANQVWGNIDGKSIKVHTYGRGRMYSNLEPAEVLRQKNVVRDFSYESLRANEKRVPRLHYIHRVTPEADFYFVSNQRDEPATVRALFRQTGIAPEIWHPETGAIEKAPVWSALSSGQTSVTLILDSAEACFVVFPKNRQVTTGQITDIRKDGFPLVDKAVARIQADGAASRLVAFAGGKYSVLRDNKTSEVIEVRAGNQIDLTSGWNVSFPLKRETLRTEFSRLNSWTEHSKEEIKYFSGTAIYTRSFELSAHSLTRDTVVEIDLGQIEVIAELQVNGQDFGVLWTAPHRGDITRALKPGKNEIVVKVTNLWRNRLIGDAILRGYGRPEKVKAMAKIPLELPEWVRQGKNDLDERTSSFTISPYYSSEDSLVPSGLIGPVRLIFGQSFKLAEK